MSKRFVVGVMVGALLASVGISIAQSPTPALADFKIVISVDSTENGVDMECTKGCAWETLSFACDQDIECSSKVDEYGMAE